MGGTNGDMLLHWLGEEFVQESHTWLMFLLTKTGYFLVVQAPAIHAAGRQTRAFAHRLPLSWHTVYHPSPGYR